MQTTQTSGQGTPDGQLLLTGVSSLWSAPARTTAGGKSFSRLVLDALGMDREHEETFLHPNIERDRLLPRLDGVAEKIASLPPGQRVFLSLDYDVDGITSGVIARQMFGLLGHRVRYFIPSRFTDHYGVNMNRIEESHAALPIDLLVTIDCGAASLKELADFSARSGARVAAIDHHHRSSEAEGLWEINPHLHQDLLDYEQHDNPYCSAVLCQMLAMRVARLRPEIAPMLKSSKILAGLAAIADVAWLRGHASRDCAQAMLREAHLPHSNAGLRLLMKKARLSGPLTSSQVSFQISPRLNAAGRLEHANLAMDLLMMTDRAAAAHTSETGPSRRLLARETVCERIDGLNRLRRDLQAQVEEEALAQVSGTAPVVLLWKKHWSHGVVGPAAGQLASRLNRYVLLGGYNEETRSYSFSGRAPRTAGGVLPRGLLELVSGAVARLTPEGQGALQFGGHSAAMGMRIGEDDAAAVLPQLRSALERESAGLEVNAPRQVAACLSAGDVNAQTLAELSALEPFGEGNPEPSVAVIDVRLQTRSMRNNPRHIEGKAASPDGSLVNLVAFNAPKLLGLNGVPVHLIGKVGTGLNQKPTLYADDVVPRR